MSTRSCCKASVAVLVLASALLGAGCQRHAETPEEHAARTAVVRYNQALVEAFRTRAEEKLVGVASEAERSRVGAIIAGLLSQGKVMMARQSSQKVEKVRRLKDDLISVETLETWQYEHRAFRDPNAPAEGKTITYRMEYQVRRVSEGWIVQHAETVEEQAGQAGGR